MPDTVGSEQHKPTSLRGIANKAKADKHHRFRDLYRCLNAQLLMDCWSDLNKNAASGVDGVTAQMYAENLHANIEALVERLKSKRYQAKLVRRHYIPKEKDKQRPLGIPAVEDKLVQAACAKLMTAIYEQDFLESSYGYRPKRGAGDAVKDLTFDLQFGNYGYLVEADVQGFFDHLDHDTLLEMLSVRIDDRAFLGLIRKWLKAGILEPSGHVVHPDTGTPQGGIVSPVTANVYLHYVLDLWFEKVVKLRCDGEAMLCRYADDWVCAFRYREDAEKFYRVLPKRLEKFNPEGSSGEDSTTAVQSISPEHETTVYLLGLRILLERRPKGDPSRRAPHGSQEVACGVQADQGMDPVEPALAGWRFLQAFECTVTGSLQLLWSSRQLASVVSFL